MSYIFLTFIVSELPSNKHRLQNIRGGPSLAMKLNSREKFSYNYDEVFFYQRRAVTNNMNGRILFLSAESIFQFPLNQIRYTLY